MHDMLFPRAAVPNPGPVLALPGIFCCVFSHSKTSDQSNYPISKPFLGQCGYVSTREALKCAGRRYSSTSVVNYCPGFTMLPLLPVLWLESTKAQLDFNIKPLTMKNYLVQTYIYYITNIRLVLFWKIGNTQIIQIITLYFILACHQYSGEINSQLPLKKMHWSSRTRICFCKPNMFLRWLPTASLSAQPYRAFAWDEAASRWKLAFQTARRKNVLSDA